MIGILRVNNNFCWSGLDQGNIEEISNRKITFDTYTQITYPNSPQLLRVDRKIIECVKGDTSITMIQEIINPHLPVRKTQRPNLLTIVIKPFSIYQCRIS